MNLKNKILSLFVQTYRKRKEVPYMEMSRDNVQKGENLLIWKNHVTLIKRGTYIRNEMQLKIILYLSFTKQITSFSYQHSISFTHGLQHYCFLGQANLYQLCGLWQMSRQIWTIFTVQKRFQLLGCKTQSIQER